jgi:hypothetical protein
MSLSMDHVACELRERTIRIMTSMLGFYSFHCGVHGVYGQG